MEFNIALYLFIFLGKMLESTIGTFKVIVVSTGMKKLGTFLQFILILVWLYLASVTLLNLQDDLLLMFAYALGSSCGTYLGVIIEEKVALGSKLIIAITDAFNGEKLASEIRNENIAVTEMDGKGKVNNKKILFIVKKRKTKNDLIKKIKKIDKKAMVLTETVGDVSGGIVS